MPKSSITQPILGRNLGLGIYAYSLCHVKGFAAVPHTEIIHLTYCGAFYRGYSPGSFLVQLLCGKHDHVTSKPQKKAV